MPPVVIRICFRCCPYTGLMMTRSKNRPSTPAMITAASMAAASAPALARKLSAPAAAENSFITEAAT